MSELKDCPLQFHDFKSVDHVKVCPRYTAVLARSEDDGIGIEELDTLQLELETLLSSASRRLRVLEAETQVLGPPWLRDRLWLAPSHQGAASALPLPSAGHGISRDIPLFQILTDWQDKKGDRRFLKLSKDHDVSTSVKHGKPKKQKLEGKGGHGTGPGPGRPKSKNLQPKIQEYEFQDDPIDVPRIPKNDAPNRCVGVGGHWDHLSAALEHLAQGLPLDREQKCHRGKGDVCHLPRAAPSHSPSTLAGSGRRWSRTVPISPTRRSESWKSCSSHRRTRLSITR